MIPFVYAKQFPEPQIRRSEILRYAGAKEASAELSALLEDALEEARSILSYKVCWQVFPIVSTETGLDLGFAETQSTVLKNHLLHCTQAVVFGATVGLGLDRLIARYGRVSPARALMLQAIGTERIEALCDLFCSELDCGVRFSPGYGDLSLEVQKKIFDILNCEKHIGLTLNDSLVMSPSKSVTAFAISGKAKDKCESCKKTDCAYRGAI